MRTTSARLPDNWTFRQLDPTGIPNSDLESWLPAEVPGHVHLDLQRLGIIPDPFERMYERTVQWVDDAAWAYRCAFDIDPTELDGARHRLRFDGLDTIATVLLNDAPVLTTDNMFVEHEVDVTGQLRAGDNALEIHFRSAEVVGSERLVAAGLDAFHVAPGLRHGLTSRSMVRKAQYHWGWDWGPRLRGCGIWRDVSLVRVPSARITDWSWRVRFDRDGRATVTVEATTEGAATDLEVRLSGHGVDLTASGGEELTLTVDDPKRWWCAGHGDQPLYDLTVVALVDGEIADEVEARIGLREVELVREPDDGGESFFFRVNGVPVFAKGANWIPDDAFPARTTRDRVFAQVRMARDCGMNMLRVWGGGLYESTDFYDACDELGLLVWQDFPYACALYPEDDDTVSSAVVEATRAVRRLRNHTSLALWCGNNENQWLAHMGFFGDVPKLLGVRLFDEVLPAVVAAEDPHRPYWPGSPWGNTETDPSGERDGDCHYWNVWHGEGDWRHFTKCSARFVSEFGFSGPPDRRTLENVLLADDLGADTPAMRWHDKTNKGYDTYLGYISLHYPAPETYEDLVYFGQLNQADAMRFGIEHFRRLRPHTMGTLVWQLNDCWPVQSWAWIDHALRPKAAWYAAKRFYAPLLLSLWLGDADTLRVSLVNDDAHRDRRDILRLRGYGADGSVVWSADSEVGVGAATSEVVHETPLPHDAAFVHATFGDVESTLLLVEPKELALPAADLRITVDPGPDEVTTLTVAADSPALCVMLWLEDADATWGDNFFHVLPGVPRTVEVGGSSTASVAERLRWRTLHGSARTGHDGEES